MRILILGNIILPVVAQSLSLPIADGGGWIGGLCKRLSESETIDLGYCFNHTSDVSGSVGKLKYYGYTKKTQRPQHYDESVEGKFSVILQDFKPDIVHIFGTEFPHTLSMVRVFNNPGCTVINIQGLCSICSQHYSGGLLEIDKEKNVLLNAARCLHLSYQKRGFFTRGQFEIEALRRVGHVIGRTDWDRACATQINPRVHYHFCNEILRDEFYHHNWDIEKCQRNSIFISQAAYPIKGLHYMLEALPEIIRRFPQTHLYVAGNDITNSRGLKDKVKVGSYGNYIRRLICKLGLREHVSFTGTLNEQQMCRQFLNSHLLVSPSTIENESNAISEAKILGVPVVASFVGGVPNRITQGKDGYLYQHDAPYMLAHYVCEIFGDDELARRLSQSARQAAANVNSPEQNERVMKSIYNEIMQGEDYENKKSDY